MVVKSIQLKADFVEFAPIILIIMLLSGYWAYCIWIEPISPYYDNYDPSFPYFMNSLSVFKGKGYAFVDHPGTPVELIGTAILGFTYPLLGRDPNGFVLYHLQNPGLFFSLAYAFLTLSSIGCALFFYKSALISKRLGDVLTATTLALMFYTLHPWSFVTLNYWSHNSFNFPFGTLYLLILFKSIQIKGEIRLWKLVGLGLAAGILTATQLYFSVWVIGAMTVVAVFYLLQNLPWYKSILASMLVGISSLAGFFLSVIPVIAQMPKFFQWVTDLIFHVGRYGGGKEGVVSLSLSQATLELLLRQFPVIFASCGILLFALSYAYIRRRSNFSNKPELWAMATGLTAQLIIAFILIIKQPLFLYMLAIAAILPVLTMVSLKILENIAGYYIIQEIFFALVTVGIVLTLSLTISNRHNNAIDYSFMEKEIAQKLEKYAQATRRVPDGIVILWTYGAISPCSSLLFGNGYTEMAFSQELSKLCPNQHNLSLWIWDQNQVTILPVNGDSQIPIADVNWDLIIARKSDYTNVIEPAIQVKTVNEEISPPWRFEPNPIVVVQKEP
jgi:hypothetical protein